jgi:hypothetical protein
MLEGGIHGINQVEPGVNQRAIQVKNQQLKRPTIQLAIASNHGFPSGSAGSVRA